MAIEVYTNSSNNRFESNPLINNNNNSKYDEVSSHLLKQRPPDDRFCHLISGKIIVSLHMLFVATSFYGSLIIGCLLRYKDLVKNEFYSYPKEYVPSVSATIGDFFPIRNFFQIFITLAAIPRFILLFSQYAIYKSCQFYSLSAFPAPSSSTSSSTLKNKSVFNELTWIIGFIRNVFIGLVSFVPSRDYNRLHEVSMILYLLFTLIYHICLFRLKSKILKQHGRQIDLDEQIQNSLKWSLRSLFYLVFVIGAMIYFFIRHKVYQVAGAYSIYSILEWQLISLDIALDYFAAVGMVTNLNMALAPFSHKRDNSFGAHSNLSLSDNQAAWWWWLTKDQLFLMTSGISAGDVYYYASEILQGYLFWSVITGFFSSLWYFPLWTLGFSGAEVGIISIFSPSVLSISWIHRLIHKNRVALWIIGCLFAFIIPTQFKSVSFIFSKRPIIRFIFLTIGTALFNLVYWMIFWKKTPGSSISTSVSSSDSESSPSDRRESILKLLLGLNLFLIVRLAFGSLSPSWTMMNYETEGYNLSTFIVALATTPVILRFSKKSSPSIPSPSFYNVSPLPSNPPGFKGSYAMASFGFGSLLFLTLTFLSESTVISRWTVSEYPSPGFHPVFSGFIVIMITLLTCVWTKKSSFAQILRLDKYFVGTMGMAVFILLGASFPYIASIGGFAAAAYIISLWFPFLQYFHHSTTTPFGSPYILVTLTMVLLLFGEIFATAYAFVPYGWLFREKTWLISLVSWILISLNLRKIRNSYFSKEGAHSLFEPSRSFDENLDYVEDDSLDSKERKSLFNCNTERNVQKKLFHWTVIILFLLLIMSVSSRLLRTPQYDWKEPDMSQIAAQLSIPQSIRYTPVSDFPFIMNAAIWNIQAGMDSALFSTHLRMAQLTSSLQIQFLGLLESDSMRLPQGNRDLPQLLGESLNMYVDYGPASSKHTWGCAFLSKYPIVKSNHYLLPSPDGELACAILATVNVSDTMVNFLVAHNGQEEDVLGRYLQTSMLADISRENMNFPLIFIGYLVTKPHQGNYFLLFKNTLNGTDDSISSGGVLNDIDILDRDRWCEYMGHVNPPQGEENRYDSGGMFDSRVGRIKKLSYGRVYPADISDTELQIGTYALISDSSMRTQMRTNALLRNIRNWLINLNLSDPTVPDYFKKWRYPENLYQEPMNLRRDHYLYYAHHFWMEDDYLNNVGFD